MVNWGVRLPVRNVQFPYACKYEEVYFSYHPVHALSLSFFHSLALFLQRRLKRDA